MAADGVNSLDLILVQGHKSIPITLKLPQNEPGERITVLNLAAEVQHVTQVPMAQQKLIFKGKTLQNALEPLTQLGMKNGSKVMLLSHKESDDPNLKVLKQVQDDLDLGSKKLSQLILEVDKMHRGLDLTPDAIDKYRKQIAYCVEAFTRLLERLDSLTLGEQGGELKAKRKQMVLEIQANLDSCDSTKSRLDDLIRPQ